MNLWCKFVTKIWFGFSEEHVKVRLRFWIWYQLYWSLQFYYCFLFQYQRLKMPFYMSYFITLYNLLCFICLNLDSANEGRGIFLPENGIWNETDKQYTPYSNILSAVWPTLRLTILTYILSFKLLCCCIPIERSMPGYCNYWKSSHELRTKNYFKIIYLIDFLNHLHVSKLK
jgi:hypothetical protein